MSKEIEISKKYKKHIKEERGVGEGKDYIPWIKIHEFSSKGRATRIMGLVTKRIHHFNSDNQLRAFLIFEASDCVIDIRETYPLLDLMKVIDDKEDLSLDKFRDKTSGEQFVITTNFLLTIKEADGKIKYIARAVKNCTELSKKITIEKLEIERRFWMAKNVDFKIITDKELNRNLCKNLQWIRETILDGPELMPKREELSSQLYFYMFNNRNIIIKDLFKDFEGRNELDRGNALYLFRYLLGIKRIVVDMTKIIDFNCRVEDSLKFLEEA
ncbi:TnsA endonuclease N-terminal domain-containing protein [Clostridium estertheticum]|uniref:Heteromeric transposase endonuclease subunit TnsA n=1 Tax=Clostridium estertheticum TaxID=238834 RepID=A0A7Y3WUF8_9CLOT|nr:TnsA endonuclease N-terminal domain-containing protein [Clostridium estertheticum]NNU78121.1 heteromeric transposase endonuclease subunit TnsA [Clostridium estertheticum]WBL47767.1 TnsA endonuclease N-terminal domain-containing protein [Clostridium estertheticum]